MPNWKDLLDELKAAGSTYDVVRRKYLRHLHEHTGRNVIAYYSGWLQKGRQLAAAGARYDIYDGDKEGFMSAIHKMDRSKGLDLILHTPGGELAATESLVDYLRSMFDTDIRAIVPQIAMSAGTMIVLASREVVMGKHSNLGAIDPLIFGMPAHGVVEEFKRARADITSNNALALLWQPILQKYSPTLVSEAEKSIQWAEEMVKKWLESGMFKGKMDAQAQAKQVVQSLGTPALTKSHARHISYEQADAAGVNVVRLEDDPELQDRVLSVHHVFVQTLAGTPAFKIIENQEGVAFIETIQAAAIAVG